MLAKIKSFLFENQNQKQTLAKNTFWLFSGQTGGRLLRAALVIYAARALGPESWGAFSYVMSLTAFLLILSDIGISAIVTRESAKNISAGPEYFSTAFFIKLFLLAIGASILIFGAPYITKIPEARGLLAIISILLIFDSLRNFGFAVSRALEQMQWEAINEAITNISIVAVGFFVLARSPDSSSLAWAYVIGAGIGLAAMAYSLREYYSKILNNFNYALIRPILSSSLPFAFASFLGAIMINTDLIMLGWMRAPEEIGFYSAAQKPIQLLYAMAGLFATSLFPLLSRLSHEHQPNQLRNILEKTITSSLFVAIPTAVVGLPLAGEIMDFLFGKEYLPAAQAFQILLLTLMIIFPSVIISNSLLAQNQQKKFIAFSLIGAIGNIVFNFLLIPEFGIAGSAVSTLATQIIANAFIWHKLNGIINFTVLGKTMKIIAASLISAILAIFLQSLQWPVLLNIITAAIAYLLILHAMKEEILLNMTKMLKPAEEVR